MPYSTKESAFLTLVMGNMHGLNSDTDIYLQKNHSTSSKVVQRAEDQNKTQQYYLVFKKNQLTSHVYKTLVYSFA